VGGAPTAFTEEIWGLKAPINDQVECRSTARPKNHSPARDPQLTI
jgi:hypothetical protein